jgi:hypothetical protein
MARFRQRALLGGLVVLVPAFSFAACNVVTGATKYDKSYCDPGACDPLVPDTGARDVQQRDQGVADSARVDGGEEDSGEAPVHMRWAHWPMPNRGDSGLPNPMTYATDGGTVVVDAVTKLEWQKTASTSMSYGDAVAFCAKIAPAKAWRVPTRIELVSLLDETANPRIAAVFGTTPGTFFWSASQPEDGSRWLVDFGKNSPMVQARDEAGGSFPVRCVRGGVQ